MASDSGLREPDEPVLLAARRSQVLVHPRHQLGRHKGLVLEVGVIGVVRVPRLVLKGWLDDGQVVLVLGVRCLQGTQAVTVTIAEPSFYRQDKEEVVSHSRSRVRWLEDPQGLGAIAVVG